MAWYHKLLGIDPPEPAALTAAASPVRSPQSQYLQHTQEWQHEAWRYYDQLGELNTAVTWLGNMLSRVRIRAAEIDPALDEPTIVNQGLAADVMNMLAGGVGGQGNLMRNIALQLKIPGDCYLVGQESDGYEDWTVRSVDEVRAQNGKFQVVTARIPNLEWGDLPPGALPVRVWAPHARYFHMADSPTRSALPIMRELELVNRHITAQYLSRLASAGLIVLPSEASFPVREEFADADDPLAAEFIEIAAEAIRTPGTAAAIVPMMIRVPAELVDKVKMIDFTLKIDEKVIDKRESAINRLANKLDIPTEIMTGMTNVNHWCVDDRTEVLTERGWLHQDQLRVGDVALTLNHRTGMSEWQPVSDIYRAPVTDEPMISMERTTHSSLTTPNHRWPVLRPRKTGGQEFISREFVHSQDLTAAHRITTGAVSSGIPGHAKYEDDLVELVAWLWTEGHVRGGRVSIAQSHTVNSPRVDRIRGALTRLYGPAAQGRISRGAPGWRESVQRNETSHGGPVTVFHLNSLASAPLLEHGGKTVRTSFVRSLTRAQLELFIDVSCQGDGWHYRSGRLDIWQKDRAVLEAYELALILSGRPVSLRPSGGGWNCAPSQDRTTVRPMKSAGGQYGQETVPYTGVVWCPVTENSTWFARRNGTVYYTGNTAWQLDEGALKTHIAPLAELICDSLTKGYLWPRMRASGATDEEISRAVVWYDMSELAMRPDKSENALMAYDRLELSGTALRREGGFDEDDAPTDEDLREQALKQIIRTQPVNSVAAINELLGSEVIEPAAEPEPATAPEGEAETEPDTGAPPGPPGGGEPPSGPGTAAAHSDRLEAERRQRAQDRTVVQSRAMHLIRFGLDTPGELLHPPVCQDHAYSCPFTHAAWGALPTDLSSGKYECRLGTFGELTVGRASHMPTDTWSATHGFTRRKAVNGNRVRR